MLALPVLDSHAPPVRVMALHALAYCPRLFSLEEVEQIRVAEGRVRYHAANVTVRVPINYDARDELRTAIDTARRLRESVERPPIADNERLCARCSLAPVCLPEEVRQERQPERDPVRLFPPDRDGPRCTWFRRGRRWASAVTPWSCAPGRGRRPSTPSAGWRRYSCT